MLQHQLYPTPPAIVEKMVAPYVKSYKDRYGQYKRYLKFDGLLIDPEAGNGAILDYVCEHCSVEKRKIVAIELESELRMLLQSKGYKVVGSDFLEYDEPVDFGLVLANPPFKDGVKHALKIWKMLAPGGKACILLNRETIDNDCTRERTELNWVIDNHNGSKEYLGQCFKDSERPTSVEVVMIRLYKPEAPKSKINFDDLQMECDGGVSSEAFTVNPLAHPNVVKDLVSRYNAVIKVLKDRDEMQSKLDFYLDGVANEVYDSVSRDQQSSVKQGVSLIDQVATVKSRFWNTVFQRTKLSDRFTSHIAKKFDEFARSQSNIAFTVTNVLEVLEMFCATHEQIMQESIEDIFDKISNLDGKNRVQGWKTNKSWKLNKKIIYPWGIKYEADWGFSTRYSGDCIYTDLDKVLCYIGQVQPKDGVDTAASISQFITNTKDKASPVDYTDEFDSYFFKLRIYKKGTVHLTFKDLDLLARFNRVVAEGRNWIGDGS